MDYSEGVEEGYAATSYGSIHFIHRPSSERQLLLLHGIGGVLKTWKRFIGEEGLDTYAIDLLGHGGSAKPRIRYEIGAQVAAVSEFIANELHDVPFIMGHSYGAWVAMECALRNRAAGIIIEDGAVLAEHSSGVMGAKSKDELLAELMRQNGNDRYVMESILDSFTGMLPVEIGRITVPTLILWGAKDSMVDVGAADRLHRLIKGSSLKIIEGAGHEPHFSNAEETATEVVNFINGAANESHDNSKG